MEHRSFIFFVWLKDERNKMPKQKFARKNRRFRQLPDMVIFDKENLLDIVGRKCNMPNSTTFDTVCSRQNHITVLHKSGYAYQMRVSCGHYGHSRTFSTSGRCRRSGNPDMKSVSPFRINRLVTIAAKVSDMRYKRITRFMSAVGFGTYTNRMYYRISNAVDRVAQKMAINSRKQAGRELRKLLKLSEDSIEDATVCVDGSYHTKGYKSKAGIATSLSAVTGKVLDCHALSNYCATPKCRKKSVIEKDSLSNTEFNDSPCHDESYIEEISDNQPEEAKSHKCDINYKGCSGGMEVVGCKRMFKRSISLHKFVNKYMVRDGDSKLSSGVNGVYGPQTLIEFMLDQNHSTKCFFHRLMNARNDATVDGKSVKGRGKITEKFAKKLASYAAHAIRTHAYSGSSLESLRTALLAIPAHCSEDHRFCPTNPGTWCTYYKSIHEKTQYVPGERVAPEIMKSIWHVFEETAKPEYLKRLLHDYKTSRNEAFHSRVWQFCTKSVFTGIRCVRFAKDIATCLWNDGSLFTYTEIFSRIDLRTPKGMKILAGYDDAKRQCQSAERKALKKPLRRVEDQGKACGLPEALPIQLNFDESFEYPTVEYDMPPELPVNHMASPVQLLPSRNTGGKKRPALKDRTNAKVSKKDDFYKAGAFDT